MALQVVTPHDRPATGAARQAALGRLLIEADRLGMVDRFQVGDRVVSLARQPDRWRD
jgi:hypothetical protein